MTKEAPITNDELAVDRSSDEAFWTAPGTADAFVLRKGAHFLRHLEENLMNAAVDLKLEAGHSFVITHSSFVISL